MDVTTSDTLWDLLCSSDYDGHYDKTCYPDKFDPLVSSVRFDPLISEALYNATATCYKNRYDLLTSGKYSADALCYVLRHDELVSCLASCLAWLIVFVLWPLGILSLPLGLYAIQLYCERRRPPAAQPHLVPHPPLAEQLSWIPCPLRQDTGTN